VDPQLPEPIRVAEEAVGDLVNACRKRGALYNQHPKEAAQVSRTAKWLLNALAALRRAWDDPCARQDPR
jgi:hypothetical protein